MIQVIILKFLAWDHCFLVKYLHTTRNTCKWKQLFWTLHRFFDSILGSICVVLLAFLIKGKFNWSTNSKGDIKAISVWIAQIYRVQGPSWQTGFFDLGLRDRNIQVRFCLKMVLKSWDLRNFAVKTSFYEMYAVRHPWSNLKTCWFVFGKKTLNVCTYYKATF